MNGWSGPFWARASPCRAEQRDSDLRERSDSFRLGAPEAPGPEVSMISKILWLSAAGTAGTLARVGLSTLVQRAAPAHPQLGTFAVNVVGCFLFGCAFGWFEGHAAASVAYRLIVLAGFMGAFTTFSSYVFENLQLAEGGRVGLAVANLVAQNALGFAALGAGVVLGRRS